MVKFMKSYDYIVVGMGTAGASTCMALAQRGALVLGLDARHPPHQSGSHHGQSRSIRRAYLEGSAYAPMAMRSWELWRKLEHDSATELLIKTPNLTIGPDDCPALTGFLASARRYEIPYQELTAAELRRRWPVFNVPKTYAAGLEIEAGILFAERAIACMLSEAQKLGTNLLFNHPVREWKQDGDKVTVITTTDTYRCRRLLLAGGARNHALCKGEISLSPKGIPVHWIPAPEPELFKLGEYPVNFWQVPPSGQSDDLAYEEFYSLPTMAFGGPIKTAPHNNLADCDPDDHLKTVSQMESKRVKHFLTAHIPTLASAKARVDRCFYSMTADGDFIIDWLPRHDRVAIVALAGHGFKFAPVLGLMLADLLQDRRSEFDLGMFSLSRFSE